MKYNPDSRLMRFLTKIADLMILNIIFVLSCLPVVTIGAAWTALYYVALKMVKDSHNGILRSFFHSFRENFRQATLLWLMILALGALLFFDFRLVASFGDTGFAKAMYVALGILSAVVLMLLQYLFPSLAKFETTIPGAIKNACLMAVGNFPRTVLMLLFSAIPIRLTLLDELSLLSGFFAWAAIAFALVAVAKSCLLVKIFNKYFPEPDAIDAGTDE